MDIERRVLRLLKPPRCVRIGRPRPKVFRKQGTGCINRIGVKRIGSREMLARLLIGLALLGMEAFLANLWIGVRIERVGHEFLVISGRTFVWQDGKWVIEGKAKTVKAKLDNRFSCPITPGCLVEK